MISYNIISDKTEKIVAYIEYEDEDTNLAVKLDSEEYPVDLFGLSDASVIKNSKIIDTFLRDRVIPEYRENMSKLLSLVSLDGYCWQDIIKITHGRTSDDNFRIEKRKEND